MPEAAVQMSEELINRDDNIKPSSQTAVLPPHHVAQTPADTTISTDRKTLIETTQRC